MTSVRHTEDGPIFVAGLDRCGKTTMRSFLASHPNISIPAVGSNMETYFYDRFGDLAVEENLRRCLDAMLRYKHVAFLRPDVERILAGFREGPPSYERLFGLFLIDHAEREGKRRWGAQTGLIERFADRLFAAYPGIRVVHMVRDPRDRYAASLERWADGRGRAGGATARWRLSIRLAQRNSRRYPDAYKVVRFEDLVRRTEAVLRDVFAFVGEAFDPDVLSMPGAAVHRERLREGSPGDDTILSERFIGRYRDVVPRPELLFMQLHAGRLMRSYGYDPDPIVLSPVERLTFALREWPDQAARMAAWRGLEIVQRRFPRRFGARPDRRMIVEPTGALP